MYYRAQLLHCGSACGQYSVLVKLMYISKNPLLSHSAIQCCSTLLDCIKKNASVHYTALVKLMLSAVPSYTAIQCSSYYSGVLKVSATIHSLIASAVVHSFSTKAAIHFFSVANVLCELSSFVGNLA